MKYICLGYIEANKWETMEEGARNAMMDECFTYDDALRKNGHFAGGEALQGPQNAVALRWKDGKAAITDGPYAETKEQLGGILVLEARDLNHAIQLMSKHPGVKAGPFEIRPAADLSAMVSQSEQRRAKPDDGDPKMNAAPQKQHHWLQKLVGDWTYESDCSMGPDKPHEQFKGSESVRSLGGLWVLCEGQGEMPGGGAARMLMTLGYNPQTQRFVGTWVGSMMTHLWVYDGELDAAERVLTLNAVGPAFNATGKMVKYKDVIELKSDDHRVLSSHSLGDDGQWREFMTANYRRTQ